MAKLNKKILIVEDDRPLLSVLQEKFEQEGFSVVTATDGKEGLIAVEKEKPDLILLDIIMPKMDGITMAQRLKRADKEIPIIILTNLGDFDRISKAMEISSFDYLVKSDWNIDDVVVRVKKKLELK